MPSLVRGEDVWIASIEGSMILVREGRRGTVGTVKSEQLANTLAAQQVLSKMVLLQRKRGFTDAPEGQELLVTEERFAEISAKRAEKKLAAAPSNPKLEAALVENPDDLDAFQVYADWLQQKNDPRGEWIAVQVALEKKRTPALEQREKQIAVEHGDLLLGALANFGTKEGSETRLEMSWKRGFLKRAHVGFDPNEDPKADPKKTIRTLFGLPSAALLQRLEIGPMPIDDENTMSFQPAIDLFVEGPNPIHLGELFIGHRGTDMEWDISQTAVGDVSKLWKAIPGLRELTLHGGSAELGTIDAPALRSFSFQCHITGDNVVSIRAARWPKLNRLEVWFGSPDYGAAYGVNDMIEIAESAPAKVKHLGLMNALFTDELIPELAKTKVLAKLESLDLSLGCLSDAGAEALLKHAKAFSHLQRLNLSQNALTEGFVRLKKIAKEVVLDKQEPSRNEGEGRYVAVGE